MEPIMLIISLLCTMIGIAIGDSAKWVSNGGTWKKMVMLLVGIGFATVGMLLFLLAFHMI